MKKLVVMCMAALLAVTCPALAGYSIIDLGVLGGSGSGATGVNNSGQVVGTSSRSPWNVNAFIWQDGVMTNLGVNSYSDSHGFGINDSGQVVGGAAAFIWQDGVLTNIGPFPGHWTSWARGINNAGQVVGESISHSPTTHAFLWTEAAGFIGLGKLPGSFQHCSARAINDAGQVVGWSYIGSWPNNTRHAFRLVPANNSWYRDNDSDGGNDLMTDLGTLGGVNSDAFAINVAGQVVGWAETVAGEEHASLWNVGAGTVDLGTLGGDTSHALSINESGQVVGYSTTNGGVNRAFLWENGAMTDLNNLIPPGSGWELTSATGINDAGWIVGSGTNPIGEGHAFLMIPEPATLLLLGFGGLFLRRKR